MGKFNDETIKRVIDKLNRSYFLPDIQREYVWVHRKDDKKIEALFDSILRGYPIGSFLFWELKKDAIETNKDAAENSDKINFQLYKFIENYDERKPHNEKIDIEKINADDLKIVLDGQQRLTSLYIGLKGSRTLKRKYAKWSDSTAYKEEKFYINLRYQPTEENPEDNYQFQFFHNPPSNSETEHWFKVGEILNLSTKDILTYINKNKLLETPALDILSRLHDTFCKEGLIAYFKEEEKNLDKVLRIFIRINSGGTPLLYSDLLMSILTANFNNDIRKEMNNYVEEIKNQGFELFGRDQVLKTCLLLTENNHIFQLKNFSKSNIRKIEDNWESIKISINEAINLLQELGYRNKLSSAYILSVVAYFHFKKKQITLDDEKAILKFIRNAQIKGHFSVSLDSKLEEIAKIIKKSENFSQINNELAEKNILKISNDDIEEMINYKISSKAVFPILQILYPNLDFKSSIFHIDHIYPKSKFKEFAPDSEYKKDFLYNLQLLEGGENKEKGAKNPEDWLNEHYNQERKMEYKEKNYIDKNFELRWDKIDIFEEERNKKIIDRLKELLL